MSLHVHTQAAQVTTRVIARPTARLPAVASVEFIAAKSCAARTHAPGYLYRATSSSRKPGGGKRLIWRAATPWRAARCLPRRPVGL